MVEMIKHLRNVHGMIRDVTIVGHYTGKTLSIGTSVRNPIDQFNKKLAVTIARGRAMKKPKYYLTDPYWSDEFPLCSWYHFIDEIKNEHTPGETE